MERLTMYNGLCQMASTEFCISQKDCYSCPHGRKCFKCLAAYEDAMPLERAKELARAEKDGRLVVLPVKEGTKIYRVRLNFDVDHYEIIENDFDLARFRPEDFGRIVFKTREEAEAALKKREEAYNEESNSNRL